MEKENNDMAKEVIALFRLSTRYKVEITFAEVIDKDMNHLTQALIGEFALPAARERGWEEAFEPLQLEIADCVLRLSEQEKNRLLQAIVFQFVLRKWSDSERKLKQE